MKLDKNFTLEKYGLQVRLVKENDADFIIKLRTNPLLSKYLHPISPDVDLQKEWIRKYKYREQDGIDYYFVFSKDGIDIGLERIYDITSNSFTHGSFIFSLDSPFGSSILADILTREIGFEIIKRPVNLFDVRKGNLSVVKYHKTYDAEIITENDESLFFKLEGHKFNKNKNRYLKMFTSI
jgi:hypothetical protein